MILGNNLLMPDIFATYSLQTLLDNSLSTVQTNLEISLTLSHPIE